MSAPMPVMIMGVASWHVGMHPCHANRADEPARPHLTPSLCACRWYRTQTEAQAAYDALLESAEQLSLW